MVGSMLHCFPTSVYFQLIAVTISSVLSPWIHDGIYSFTQWSTCFHLSAILYGPANVQDFSRRKCLYMNKPYEWYGKWCICKFHWNCIFEVWIQKQSWNVSFLKEQNTELHAMWGDRQMDVRQTWKTPSILVTWPDNKNHYYNCWSLHALGKPKYMQKRKHLLITVLYSLIVCL